MTAFAAAALAALTSFALSALVTPHYADGRKVPRTRRTPWGNLAALFGRPYPSR